MRKTLDIRKLTYSAMFLAIAFVLPFFTGQIQQIGSMLCPMHSPVLLCGYICGAPWGMLVGFITPMLRSMLLGMPPMFPVAFCMAFELGTYGFVAGFLHKRLPRKKWYIYISLLCSMVIGRVVWGIMMFACMGFDTGMFGWSAFISGAITTAIPGILLQIIVIPIIVITLERVIKE